MAIGCASRRTTRKPKNHHKNNPYHHWPPSVKNTLAYFLHQPISAATEGSMD